MNATQILTLTQELIDPLISDVKQRTLEVMSALTEEEPELDFNF